MTSDLVIALFKLKLVVYSKLPAVEFIEGRGLNFVIRLEGVAEKQ